MLSKLLRRLTSELLGKQVFETTPKKYEKKTNGILMFAQHNFRLWVISSQFSKNQTNLAEFLNYDKQSTIC